MTVPIIGAKPQLPPTHIYDGAHEDYVFLHFGPCRIVSIEEAETIVQSLQAAIAKAKAQRAPVADVVQGNGAHPV